MTQSGPNLVFVFADQMRGFDMACAGNPDVLTPNFDRFASEGASFNRAYANAPVCTPSRGTILTGLFPLDHGAVANDLPLGNVTSVADILKAVGYRTGYIGKWHLDGVPRTKFTPPGSRRHGFDYWAAYNCSHEYYRATKYYSDDAEAVLVPGYEPEVQTELACKFVRENAERPFVLYLSWGPPHDPYPCVPEPYRKVYEGRVLAPRANVDLTSTNELAIELQPEETLRDYYAAITALDDLFGRLLSAIDDAGVAENTIVIFTSDHGDMLWSHGMMYKQQPWEEAIRIPLLVRWPKNIVEGAVIDGLVSTIDFVPTIVGLMNVPNSVKLPGRDLTPVLCDGKAIATDSVFLLDIVSVDQAPRQGLGEWRGVRTPRYTYAERLGRRPWVLFDNVNDPYQLRNLANRPECKDLQVRLAGDLDRWLTATHDAFLSGPEHLRSLGLEDAWSERERSRRRDPNDRVLSNSLDVGGHPRSGEANHV